MTGHLSRHPQTVGRRRMVTVALPVVSRLFRRLTVLLVLLSLATPVWAVQAHGGVEGLVTHQLGHLFFTTGMGYLLYRLALAKTKGPGWFEFRLFLWLLIAWNLVSFTGHWMNQHVDAARYVREGAQIVAYRVDGPWDALFYATQFDHLVLLPAFTALVLALLKWRREP